MNIHTIIDIGFILPVALSIIIFKPSKRANTAQKIVGRISMAVLFICIYMALVAAAQWLFYKLTGTHPGYYFNL